MSTREILRFGPQPQPASDPLPACHVTVDSFAAGTVEGRTEDDRQVLPRLALGEARTQDPRCPDGMRICCAGVVIAVLHDVHKVLVSSPT